MARHVITVAVVALTFLAAPSAFANPQVNKVRNVTALKVLDDAAPAVARVLASDETLGSRLDAGLAPRPTDMSLITEHGLIAAIDAGKRSSPALQRVLDAP